MEGSGSTIKIKIYTIDGVFEKEFEITCTVVDAVII
jgi:hypothetical protein